MALRRCSAEYKPTQREWREAAQILPSAHNLFSAGVAGGSAEAQWHFDDRDHRYATSSTACCGKRRLSPFLFAGNDLQFLTRAAELADTSAGERCFSASVFNCDTLVDGNVTNEPVYAFLVGVSQPHPNAGCVLVSATGQVLAETYLAAQV